MSSFANFVFENNLDLYEALSDLDIVNIGIDVTRLNDLMTQTRSELNDVARLADLTEARVNTMETRFLDIDNTLTIHGNNIVELNTETEELTTTTQFQGEDILRLQQQIVGTNQIVTNLLTGVNSLNNSVTTINGNVAALTTRVTALETVQQNSGVILRGVLYRFYIFGSGNHFPIMFIGTGRVLAFADIPGTVANDPFVLRVWPRSFGTSGTISTSINMSVPLGPIYIVYNNNRYEGFLSLPASG